MTSLAGAMVSETVLGRMSTALKDALLTTFSRVSWFRALLLATAIFVHLFQSLLPSDYVPLSSSLFLSMTNFFFPPHRFPLLSAPFFLLPLTRSVSAR